MLNLFLSGGSFKIQGLNLMNNILISIISFLFGAIITGIICYKKLAFEKEKNISLNNELNSKTAQLTILEQNKTNKDELIDLIKKEFQAASNEVLIEKQKSLQEQNLTSLEGFLKPLKERIKEFQTKVEQFDETGKINNATLKQKIEELIKQNQITCTQTEKLSNAISQNSKFRGTLGEMILDKLLKASGLIDKKENPIKGNYETQAAFHTNDDTNSQRNVDAVVYLSEGTKSIVIDSKASLTEFMNYMEENDTEAKQKHLSAFLKDISDRVDELSNKYTNLKEITTPDFTIMFIPFESSLTYVYQDNKLIEEALKKNIIIAGPSTLIATLRTINYSWAQKNQYDNIKNITKLAQTIYEKCIVLIQKFESVQASFETVRKNFDGVFATIKGRGGLIGQIEKLKDYGLSPAKQIESKYLEEEMPLIETK